MNEHEFLSAVERRTDVESPKEAAVVADATLRTLGDRIEREAAAALADQLPRRLADSLTAGPADVRGLSVEEFLDRVEAREVALGPLENIDAEAHARATFEVLDEAVSGSELEAVRAGLPGEYEAVFESAEPAGRVA